MLAHLTTLFFLAPLLFLLAGDNFTSPVQAQQPDTQPSSPYNDDRDDFQDWAMETRRESVEAQVPVAVRKMMGQEAEMFFQDYWQFEQEDRHQPTTSGKTVYNSEVWMNTSLLPPLLAPIALHQDSDASSSPLRWARGLVPHLHNRAFQCPTNTNACTDIDRPNSCCPYGDSCQLMTNTGQGDVACCGIGHTCAGKVQNCAPNYQSCPSNEGGGCCLPGSTTTVIVNPQVTASPPTSSQSSSPPATTTSSSALAPLPFGPPSATSSSQTTVTTSTTSTTTSGPPTSSSSSSPSPTASSSSSSIFFAPARPTSAAVVTTHYASAAPSCPTGFYQCSAYYHGGCCRIGRDCGLSDCPASASSTVAQGDGVTIVAPSQAAVTGAGCAPGWTTCGKDVGGGCCPPGGFECGRESCTKGVGAKVTGTGVTVGKSAGVTSGGGKMGGWALRHRIPKASTIVALFPISSSRHHQEPDSLHSKAPQRLPPTQSQTPHIQSDGAGIDIKYAQQGLSLLQNSLHELPQSPSFARQVYIHALVYLLQSLPAYLSGSENASLRCALPSSLLVAADPLPRIDTEDHEPQTLSHQVLKVEVPSSKHEIDEPRTTHLHRTLSAFTTALVLFTQYLLPHFRSFFERLVYYDKTYRIRNHFFDLARSIVRISRNYLAVTVDPVWVAWCVGEMAAGALEGWRKGMRKGEGADEEAKMKRREEKSMAEDAPSFVKGCQTTEQFLIASKPT
ncbi:MAG: hypothetical protein Q9218_000174 [Villophora microphyllina]